MNHIILHTPTLSKAITALVKGRMTKVAFEELAKMVMKNTRLTLVGIPNTETNELSVGLAVCSYPDNFNKKKGVELATKRAIENPIHIVDMEDHISSYKCCLEELHESHAEVVGDLPYFKRLIGGKN